MSELEKELLEVWRRHPSRRDLRLNSFAELGLSETRAAQIVNHLIGRPEAWERDPLTVGRLARLRSRVAR